jgi:hypothetical protein
MRCLALKFMCAVCVSKWWCVLYFILRAWCHVEDLSVSVSVDPLNPLLTSLLLTLVGALHVTSYKHKYIIAQ